jgi:uncharacterized protein (TIGR03084 family)
MTWESGTPGPDPGGTGVAGSDVFTDLAAEAHEVDLLVADLPPSRWADPTPAPGWTVAHQIAHLTATFRMATMAATDPDGFQAATARLSDQFDANVHAALTPFLKQSPEALLVQWRDQHRAAVRALATAPRDRPVPWLVRPIPATVLAAAGMMELIGHGQDILDALGRQRRWTDRIRHVAAFAVRTWDFGYLARGLDPPAGAMFGYQLKAPSGAVWRFGPSDASQMISGPASDLCLLVTRRRHRADLALVASGPEADRWLDIAQAYRGPAGPGRSPGQFTGGGH